MADYLSHFLIAGIPAAAAFGCFHPYRHQALSARKLHSGPLREATLYLYVLCLAGLAGMILWPGYHFEEAPGLWGNLVIHNARESFQSNLNLRPLRMVGDYLRAFRERRFGYAIVMLFGNIGVFLPLGLLPALLFRSFGPKKAFLCGLAFSLTGECLQFFLGRHCDVDDVLLNVTGVMLGYLLAFTVRRRLPRFAEKLRCKSE